MLELGGTPIFPIFSFSPFYEDFGARGLDLINWLDDNP